MATGRMTDHFLKSRTARIFLLCLAALLLLLAVWLVFFRPQNASDAMTERETRLVRLLTDLEGIRSATAMIAEEEGIPVSAIVVFSGQDSLLVRARVINVTAAALNLDVSKIQVYPAD